MAQRVEKKKICHREHRAKDENTELTLYHLFNGHSNFCKVLVVQLFREVAIVLE